MGYSKRLIALAVALTITATPVYAGVGIGEILGSNTAGAKSTKSKDELDTVKAYNTCMKAIAKTNAFKDKTTKVTNKTNLKVSVKDSENKTITGNYATDTTAEIEQKDGSRVMVTTIATDKNKQKTKEITYLNGSYLYYTKWLYDGNTNNDTYIAINQKTHKATTKKNDNAGYTFVSQCKQKLIDALKLENKPAEITDSTVTELFGSWYNLTPFTVKDIKTVKGKEDSSYTFTLDPLTLNNSDLKQFNLKADGYKGDITLSISIDKNGYVTSASYKCNITTALKNYKAPDSTAYANASDGTVTYTKTVSSKLSNRGKTDIEFNSNPKNFRESTTAKILDKIIALKN